MIPSRRTLRLRFHAIRRQWKRWAGTRAGRVVLKSLRYGILLGIIGYLIYQITAIGWLELWKALPANPLFYILFVGIYLTLPVIESLVYRHAWCIPFFRVIPAIQQKRVYNSEVAGYSGEFFLFMWARKNTDRKESDIWRSIKDNTIISSMSTTSFAILLLVYFLSAGELNLVDSDMLGWLIIGATLVAGIIITVIILRKSIFHLPGRSLLIIGSLHIARILAANTMLVLQWMVVMPEVSISAWITYLSVKIVIHWLPMIPAKDMFFLGASFELSRAMGVSPAGIAGMLLVSSALNRIANTGTFTWFSFTDRRSPKTNQK
jgi:hypothetical protein